MLMQKRERGQNHSRGAVAALHGIAFDEGLLQRMQLLSLSNTFNRGDLFTRGAGDGRQTRAVRDAIDKNRTGAALAFAATIFGSREIQFFAQNIKEGAAGIAGNVIARAIHQQFHEFILDPKWGGGKTPLQGGAFGGSMKSEGTTAMATTTAADLTTTQAPFIEQAQRSGELFIYQPYELYSERNQEAWRTLYARMLPRWKRYANGAFLKGIESLCLAPGRLPRLEDVNRFLGPLTGFQAKPVSGYVPAFVFFDCLRNRQFPTTITIRDAARLDYLPEPDIFHDIAGHVPMHTDRAFADALVRFGECAHTAAEVVENIGDSHERAAILTSIIRAMARFFWFTIEFGLMGTQGGIRVYGSGLLSSYGEIEHAVESPEVQRYPLQLEWAINQCFEIDHYQPLLFVVDSFEHLFSAVDELERWMKAGKLNNVAPGEPAVNERDLESFLEASKQPREPRFA
jgi:phenylalanine-4-hydroxylase